MRSSLLFALWMPAWFGGLEGKRLEYLSELSRVIVESLDRQDPYYTPPEITLLHRYYVLSYTRAVSDGEFVPKYKTEFDKLNKTLSEVDWGSLKVTEGQKRMDKLEVDLKTMKGRLVELRAKRTKEALTPKEAQELVDLTAKRKEAFDEYIKLVKRLPSKE